MLFVGHTRTAEQRRQLIRRMEPLAVESAKLKEAVKLMEKNIQRAQLERIVKMREGANKHLCMCINVVK